MRKQAFHSATHFELVTLSINLDESDIVDAGLLDESIDRLHLNLKRLCVQSDTRSVGDDAVIAGMPPVDRELGPTIHRPNGNLMGDHHGIHVLLVKELQDVTRIDVDDLRVAELVVGQDAGLPARERDGLQAPPLQRLRHDDR